MNMTVSTRFPSPYGEVGFDRASEKARIKKPHLCFRPLTGKLVLIAKALSCMTRAMTQFPSPYGEVGFDRPKST